jgi:hypothetical protein
VLTVSRIKSALSASLSGQSWLEDAHAYEDQATGFTSALAPSVASSNFRPISLSRGSPVGAGVEGASFPKPSNVGWRVRVYRNGAPRPEAFVPGIAAILCEPVRITETVA